MDRIDHLQPAQHRNWCLEAFDIPHHEARRELYRYHQQHHDLIGDALHRVELVMWKNLVRTFCTLEDPVTVVHDLLESLVKKLPHIKFGVIDRDLVREQVKPQPDKVVGDDCKRYPVMCLDGRFEAHQVKQVRIPDMCASDDQRHETQCVQPMPDTYWQRINV